METFSRRHCIFLSYVILDFNAFKRILWIGTLPRIRLGELGGYAAMLAGIGLREVLPLLPQKQSI
jgi:hypothetical protein